MKKLLFILSIFVCTVSFGQTIVEDGVEYEMHKVKRKETLYGISKQYDVSIDAINKANPELKDGLKKGMKIKIPKTPELVNQVKEVTPKENQRIHTVAKGETMYAISRKYEVSVDDILSVNTGIDPTNLPVGTTLILPSNAKEMPKEQIVEVVSTVEVKDSLKKIIIEHRMEAGETVYSLVGKYKTTFARIKELNPEKDLNIVGTGDVIKVETAPLLLSPADQITLNNPTTKRNDEATILLKENYQVSLFLPFMMDKNDQIKKNRKPSDPDEMYGLTEYSTQYYMGTQLALDTLAATGVSVTLNVFDTKQDTNRIANLLKRPEVMAADLIIGPLEEETSKKAQQFAKEKNIQLICPTNQPNKSIFNNPNVSELVASLPTQAEYLARYVAANLNNQNVILIAGKTPKDKYLADLIEKIYNDSIKNKTNNFVSQIKRYDFGSYISMNGIEAKLTNERKNIILFPTTDKGLATSFFTQFNIVMNKKGMEKHEVAIYALDNFQEYDNIDIDHRVKYNLHVTSSTFINLNDPSVNDFRRKFRDKFGTEPNEWAYMGYDAMLYHGVLLQNYGKYHADFYSFVKIPLVHTKFDLSSDDPANGYENKHVYILSYSDYELNQVN